MQFCTKNNVKAVENYIQQNRENIISDLLKLVRIPSIKGNATADAPYGKECAEVLRQAAELFEINGFKTKINSESGYALSYYGKEDAKDIGVFSHGDVVPVGDDWIKCKPFEPVVENGIVYGRGCNDDKSGIITALYAAKAIKELGFDLKNRLVMFTGSNEETGMKDIEAFAKSEKMPDVSIVPDAEYPCISGEKSMIDFSIESKNALQTVKSFKGGRAFNIILDEVEAVLEHSDTLYNRISESCRNDNRYTVSTDNKMIKVVSKGISKHAAYPEGSVNAAVLMADMLCKCDALCENDRTILADLSRLVTDYYGKGFGIEHNDDVFGKLTCANGIVGMNEGRISAVFNVRCGTSCYMNAASDKILDAAKEHWNVSEIKCSEGYNIDEDSEALEVLIETYRHLSGDSKAKDEKCSGGTYARHLKNAMPVGTTVPYITTKCKLPDGHGDVHQPDESLCIDAFLESIKMIICMIMEIDAVI